MVAMASLVLLLLLSLSDKPKKLMIQSIGLSSFALIMAVSNVILDRQPISLLNEGLGNKISLNWSGEIRAGWISGGVILLKAWSLLAMMLLLNSLFSFQIICDSARSLGLPQLIATQLLLIYRFGGLLREEASSLNRARQLRSFHSYSWVKSWRSSGLLLGNLLFRSILRSERVHQGMISRGFRERIPQNIVQPMSIYDWGCLSIFAIVLIALRLYL